MPDMQLHRRIASLENLLAARDPNHKRIRQEDDPRSHTSHHSSRSAAAEKPIRDISNVEERDHESNTSVNSDEEQALGETYGTLAIDPNGDAKFVGSLAGSAYLQDYHGDDDQDPRQQSTPPPMFDSMAETRKHPKCTFLPRTRCRD